nr:hypothetical protein BaRGS_031336 [Batillaria attramentaria]
MKEGAENRRDSSGRSALDKELTLKDVFEKLAGMESGIKQSLENLDLNIEEKLKNLKDEMLAEYATVQEKVRELREEVQDLRQENEQLRSKLDGLYLKTDDLECRSRRNNVLIYGLPKADNETAEECEQTVQEFLTDKLELPETVQFDRVHRTSNKPNAPIIARCVLFKDKVSILKARAKLKGSKIFVNEDFSLRVREIRRKLLVHMKEAKDAGKKTTLVYDHLFIEGKKFVLVDDGSIREVRGETSD